MQWIAPSKNDMVTDTLEKRLWDAASSRRGSRADDPSAYHADGILYLPEEARFDYCTSSAVTKDKLGNLSVRRNELIADIFARMHKVERMGSGFKRIRETMEAVGLPFPTITIDEFFVIEFQRTKIKPVEGVNEGVIGNAEGLF